MSAFMNDSSSWPVLKVGLNCFQKKATEKPNSPRGSGDKAHKDHSDVKAARMDHSDAETAYNDHSGDKAGMSWVRQSAAIQSFSFDSGLMDASEHWHSDSLHEQLSGEGNSEFQLLEG